MDWQDHKDGGHSYGDNTFSIHAYGIAGTTKGLASLFEEGPKILAEKKKKKTA